MPSSTIAAATSAPRIAARTSTLVLGTVAYAAPSSSHSDTNAPTAENTRAASSAALLSAPTRSVSVVNANGTAANSTGPAVITNQ